MHFHSFTLSIQFLFLFLGTFEFPFQGVSQTKALPLKEKLEAIVGDILEIPKEEVDSVIGSKLGHVQIDFFVQEPKEEVREMCDSGRMPPKILRALEQDSTVKPLLDTKSKIPWG